MIRRTRTTDPAWTLLRATANDFLNTDRLALLLGMLRDQQVR